MSTAYRPGTLPVGRRRGGALTRCRPSFEALVLVLATLSVVPSASAQYRPPEPLPEIVPPQPGSPQPDPGRIGWGWAPGLILDGGWEQNIGFTRPAGPDDFFGALRASLARVRRGPRSDFRLTVSGVGYVYREVSNYNRMDAFVDLSSQGPLSPRVDGRLSGSYDFAHTDSERSLIEVALLLPLERTKTANAATGFTWRASERTSVTVDGSWTQLNFESDRYLDTTYWIGTVTLERRISLRHEVSLNGVFRRTEDDLSTRQGPALTAGYGHLFGTSLRLRLAAGMGEEDSRPSAPDLEPERRQEFFASVNLAGRVRRATVSLGYQHGLVPRVGQGVSEVTDSFTSELMIPIGRRLELLTTGALAIRADGFLPDAPTQMDWDAYLGAAYRLADRLRLVVGYRFRVRDDQFGTIHNDRATVSLAYERRTR